MNKLLIFLSFVVLLQGCGQVMTTDKGAVIARVHDNYLYEDDIEGLIPVGASVHDSLLIIKNLTENWIRTQLMVIQAKKNLSGEQLNFDKQLEEYRNSLIIYRFETEFINQRLDTIVGNEEIEQYYNDHLSDFELKENIVRLQYVIIDNEQELESLFRQLFKMPDSLMIDSLEVYGKQYAKSYFLESDTWVSFDELLDIIPIETYNQELFLKGKKFITLSDEKYTYLVNFVDFKLKNEMSPLEFRRDDIVNLIINKRKLALIKQVREDIFMRAVENNEFEVYYNE